MNLSPAHMIDFYKSGHIYQYPEKTELIFSNLTARSARDNKVDSIVFFGLQYTIKKYFMYEWSVNFFDIPIEDIVHSYLRRMNNALGKDSVGVEHIESLHKLGYLPIEIRAVKEGAHVDIRVPCMTIYNTLPEFFWLTNYLETILSCSIWPMITSATMAFKFKKLLAFYAGKTGGDKEFVKFQGHDFSFRGMFGLEAAMMSGAAHLTSFVGTDTVPAIDFLEEYYGADCEKELVGCSVPATEHSVMSLGGDDDEIGTIRKLILTTYPSGIVSIVSDTWDFWKVITEYLPTLKDEIMARDGKVVIRPDCYDEKTMLRTENGWEYFSELNENIKVAQVLDDGSYEFIKPIKIIKQEYRGLMHHFKDQKGKVDLLVTPNHRMVVNVNNKECIVKAQNLTTQGYYYQTMKRSASAQSLPDVRISSIDRLKIAFQADGSFTTSGDKIRFSFSKQRKIDRLKEILFDCRIDYKIYPLKDGRVEFNINISADNFQKDFSWVETKYTTKEWAQDFIEELSYWDSTRRSEYRFKFDTTNKEVIEKVELVSLAAGYGVLISKWEDSRKEIFSDLYTAHIMKDNFIGGQSWTNTTQEFDGTVYCVTVPSGKLLVKRNRSTMVCGNSGDPGDIICGNRNLKSTVKMCTAEAKGSIECLWDIFGGTVNDKGYKELDSHIGLIYGDSITLDRCRDICNRLEVKGFASTNVVFGIGSFTYQFTTRDVYGFAIKATYAEVDGKAMNIFKKPKTDDGTKNSAKGLTAVYQDPNLGYYHMKDEASWDEFNNCDLELVFKDGKLIRDTTLAEIRGRLK